jgi:hypothetical protein
MKYDRRKRSSQEYLQHFYLLYVYGLFVGWFQGEIDGEYSTHGHDEKVENCIQQSDQ